MAHSDVRKLHAFMQWDREFSNSLHFCMCKKSDDPTAFLRGPSEQALSKASEYKQNKQEVIRTVILPLMK